VVCLVTSTVLLPRPTQSVEDDQAAAVMLEPRCDGGDQQAGLNLGEDVQVVPRDVTAVQGRYPCLQSTF